MEIKKKLWCILICFVSYLTCLIIRAKKIQNKAVVNESPTDRLIRELKEENAKLMAALGKGGKKADNSEGGNIIMLC